MAKPMTPLEAGQAADIVEDGHILVRRPANIGDAVAWREGRVVFRKDRWRTSRVNSTATTVLRASWCKARTSARAGTRVSSTPTTRNRWHWCFRWMKLWRWKAGVDNSSSASGRTDGKYVPRGCWP